VTLCREARNFVWGGKTEDLGNNEMQHIPQLDADRLTKLLGLLSSNHDGEIAAAGRKAHALVKSAGLTWPDIIKPMPVVTQPQQPDPYEPPNDPPFVILARHIERMNDGVLNDWELRFVQDIQTWTQPLTYKQVWLVERLAKRTGVLKEDA
jgi:hypothetical protein